jgi:hypothetical protein
MNKSQALVRPPEVPTWVTLTKMAVVGVTGVYAWKMLRGS